MTSLVLIPVWLLLLCCKATRRFALCMLPWFLFPLCYQVLVFFPSSLFRDISTLELYTAEQSLFGIATSQGTLTPNEFCALHHFGFADVMSGLFYLCWVPAPLAFSFYLFFKGEQALCRRCAWSFLVTNLVGFVGYYVYPAAPPWYIMEHGFQADLSVHGSVAGFAHFEQIIGCPIFSHLYKNNSNVFAAMPSLHSAYCFVAFIYAVVRLQLLRRSGRQLTPRHFVMPVIFGVLSVGIWLSAVYSCHHYVLDVLAGIVTALVGTLLYEAVRRSSLRAWQ